MGRARQVRSIRKIVMYSTLFLFILVGVIGIYLAMHQKYDEGLWNMSTSLQIITENLTLNQYKVAIDVETLSKSLHIPASESDQQDIDTENDSLDVDTLDLIDPNNSNQNIQIIEENDRNLPSDIISDHNDYIQALTSNIVNAEISNGHIPSSWQDLNNQQFCSIHSESPQEKLLKTIYELQFERSCNINEQKFLIYDIALESSRGLGASLYGWLCRFLVVALQTNRTLLFHGQFDWTIDSSYCNNTNGMECYFLPLSRCNPFDILDQIGYINNTQLNNDDFHQGPNPTNCKFGDNDPYHNLTQCQYKVIYITGKPRKISKPLLQRPISNFGEENFGIKIFELEAVMVGFLLRPQPNVKRIIYQKILKSVNKSLNGRLENVGIKSENYISMPIRASDKCKNIGDMTHKKYKHKAEVTCFTPIEYMFMMNILKKYSNTKLNGVILTSEDSNYLDSVIDKMKNDHRSKVKDWNIILNTEDYSVGEGTTTYKQTQSIYNVSYNSKLGTSIEYDHIVSALSSLILQLHLETEYMVWLYESSWTELMWNWLAILNCNVIRKKHKPNYNKCCKLLSSGYIHKRKHNRFELDKDIWNKVRQDGLFTDDDFYNKYNIYYAKNTYCNIKTSKNRIAK